jgi:hypothetical protein
MGRRKAKRNNIIYTREELDAIGKETTKNRILPGTHYEYANYVRRFEKFSSNPLFEITLRNNNPFE